jgi:CRISPR-associated protein Cas2
VQNSAFEGEITEAKLKELQLRLKKLMNEKEDSVLIYRFREESQLDKEVMGVEKSSTDSFL